jgi:hypothetical protein
MPLPIPSFKRQIRTFIKENTVACIATLGLAAAGYAIGNLLGRAIRWYQNAHGGVLRVSEVAQTQFSTRLPLTKQAATWCKHIEFQGKNSLLYFVPVLNQDRGACIWHVMKNSVVMLGMGSHFSHEDLQSNETFQNHLFHDNRISTGHFWNYLSSVDKPYDDLISEQIRQVVLKNPNAHTILTEIDTERKPFFNAFTKRTPFPIVWLDQIANLFEISQNLQNKKPFQHTFAVACFNAFWTRYKYHDISLLLSQDADGSISWCGADSMSNNREKIPESIAFIDWMLRKVATPQSLKEIYLSIPEYSGLSLQCFTRLLHAATDALNLEREDSVNQLLRKEQKKYFISSVAFMIRVGWLKEESQPLCKDIIDPMREVAMFYSKKSDDPEMQEACQTLLAV